MIKLSPKLSLVAILLSISLTLHRNWFHFDLENSFSNYRRVSTKYRYEEISFLPRKVEWNTYLLLNSGTPRKKKTHTHMRFHSSMHICCCDAFSVFTFSGVLWLRRALNRLFQQMQTFHIQISGIMLRHRKNANLKCTKCLLVCCVNGFSILRVEVECAQYAQRFSITARLLWLFTFLFTGELQTSFFHI